MGPTASREHPLRRRYGAELALGIGLLVLASAALFLGRGPRPGRSAEPGAEARAAAAGEDAPREAKARTGSREAVAWEIASSEARPDSFTIVVVDETGHPLADVPVDLVLEEPLQHDRPRFVCLRTGASDARGRAEFALAQLELPPHAAATGVKASWRATTSPEFADGPSVVLPESIAAGSSFRLVLSTPVAAAFGTLRVRVVDRSGAPVNGAPVRWRASPDQLGSSLFQEGATEGDGIAELSLLPYRRLRASGLRGGPPVHYCVELAVPPESPRLELGRDFPPREMPTLVLPEVGTLVVRVAGHDGEPVRDPVTVEVFGWQEGPNLDDESIGAAPIVAPSAPEGAATFPLVGLGLSLRVVARRSDQSTEPGRLELSGPRAAGERVQATVRLGRSLPMLRARVVDERGAPLARTRVQAILSGKPGSWPQGFRREADTDEEGFLCLPLIQSLPGSEPRTLSLATPATLGERARPELCAELELASLDVGAVNDLGTVVLRAR